MPELEPNTPVRGKWPGIAAIDYNGDRYCLDCAERVLDGQDLSVQLDNGNTETIENANGEEIVDRLISGDIYTLNWGGVVLRDSESPIMHCGRHKDCENAISGENHPYDHDVPVGGRLDLVEIE